MNWKAILGVILMSPSVLGGLAYVLLRPDDHVLDQAASLLLGTLLLFFVGAGLLEMGMEDYER